MHIIGYVAEKPKAEPKPEKAEAPKAEEKPEKAAPKAKK